MDSDEADFQPGPSFHTAVKQEKVKFEPPLKKNRKKTSEGRPSFFKMKVNKYLNKNNPVDKESIGMKHKNSTLPSKQVEEKEIRCNDKKHSKEHKVAKNVLEVVDKRRKGTLNKRSSADLTSLDIRVKNMVKQVRREDYSSFSESSLDDSIEDPNYKAADTSESSTDEEEGELLMKSSFNASKQPLDPKHRQSEKSKMSKGKVDISGQKERDGVVNDVFDVYGQTISCVPSSSSPTHPVTSPPASQPDLAMNIISVKQAISHKCQDCGKAYVNMGSLVKHMKFCKKSNICLKCDKKFKKVKYLKIHVKLQHSDSQYSCENCDLQFETKSKLKSHKKLAHPVNKVMCSICQKEFKNKNSLRVHRNKCHKNVKIVKKTWLCSVCSKTFQSDRGLRHHKIHHKNLDNINKVKDVQDHGSET